MNVRLNITMDPDVYRALKQQVRPKGISSFINQAVRAHLQPDEATLDAAYKAAAAQGEYHDLMNEWDAIELEGWPT